MNYYLFFPIILVAISIMVKYFSVFYTLDKPDHRKRHSEPISQIGGLAFGLIFIALGFVFNLLPEWFIVGSMVSIILGVLDDNFDVSWYLKLLIQLFLVAYLTYIFWGRFDSISFYQYNFIVNPYILLIIFSIWFIGLYNAVNLIDGLDGLSAGFVTLISLSLGFLGDTIFSELNILLGVLLIAFLILNQRPAKVFMGDAGSLFLGFYIATIPLLYMDLVQTTERVIPMTPFVILGTFLIADTTRVFFTRLLSGKNPMTADTIHFHHLMIQNSGSYLLSLSTIFIISAITCIFSIFSIHYNFGPSAMLIHMALLFLFVLTPPAPTYVKFLSSLIKPFYSWQKSKNNISQSFIRTFFIMILVFLLLISILLSQKLIYYFNLQFFVSIFFITIFIILNKSKKIVIPAIQVFITLIIIEFNWSVSFGMVTQLLTIILLIALIVFTVQKINATEIYQYSALDILITIIGLSGIFLSKYEMAMNPWIFPIIISLWFGLGFILRRKVHIT